MDKQNVVVVGAGAMGALFSALLSRSADIDVTLVAKDSSAAARLKKKGIIISGKTRLNVPPQKIKIISSAVPSGDNLCRRRSRPSRFADLVIILVKSFDTSDAVGGIASVIGKDTVTLTLQNGLGNIEAIRKTLRRALVPGAGALSVALAGTTTHGAGIIETGRVVHTGRGETLIAYDSAAQEKSALRAARILSSVGIKAEAVRGGAASVLWSKLIVNAAINPVGAVFNQTNGEVLGNDFALGIALNAAREASAVARAAGIRLLYPSPSEKIKSVLAATSRNKNSMLRDVLSGRRTEIEAITGSILRFARLLGVAVPYNRALYNSVKICE